MLKIIFIFTLFISSTLFCDPDSKNWSKVISVVHQVRELLESGDKAEPWRFEKVKNEVASLTPNEVIQFLNKAYRSGLLHLDQFREDLDFIGQLVKAEGETKSVTQKIRELEFDRLAFQIAEVPQEVVNTTAEPDSESHALEEDIAAFLPPGAVKAVTLEAKARAHIGALQKSIQNVLKAQEAFAKSGEKVGKYIWWVDSIVKAMGLTAAMIFGAEHLNLENMKPREMVAWGGAVWAGHVALYYFIWDQLELMKACRKKFSPTLYQELVNSWAALIRLVPQLSSRTAAAAAQDKPLSHRTRMDEFADAAFVALVQDDSHHTTRSLFDLALRYLENDQPSMARKALEALHSRAPQDDLAPLDEAVSKVFAAKRKLEWKALFRQAGWAGLKIGALVIGYLVIDLGVRNFTPEWFHQWRTLPGALMAAIGARKAYSFFMRPLERERIEKHSSSDRERLLSAFRELMKADPSGALVSRIAQNPGTHATQQIFTEAAVQALSEVPSGEVAMNMFRMLRQKLTLNNNGRKGIEYLVAKTFEQQVTCLDSLVRASTELANGLRASTEPLPPEVTVDSEGAP